MDDFLHRSRDHRIIFRLGAARGNRAFATFCNPLGLEVELMLYTAPIGVLNIHRKANDGLVQEPAEPIYGGYANRRGEISLFGESIVYRVNLKKNTVQQWPPLNPGAQVRYDATKAGEVFEYGNVSFRRLSSAQIAEICSSGAFRIIPKSF